MAGRLFQDEFFDKFGTWALAYIPYGGADIGEILTVAHAVGEGDEEAFYNAWVSAADRMVHEADTRLAQGHEASARALLLKASCFYASSYHPLYGESVDPRLLAAFRKQVAASDRALAQSKPPVALLRIAFEGTSMPAYLVPALGQETEVRPLLILTKGYDATTTDMYFASAVAATRRGYHCLLFDGPGQGEMLYEQGIRLRQDWETIVAAVVDFALKQPLVGPDRIVLCGWSLGGHPAPRAASGEHRLAALIADLPTWGIAEGFRPGAVKMGASSEAAANLGARPKLIDHLFRFISDSRQLRWKVVQHGFLVHGVSDYRLICAQPRSSLSRDGRDRSDVRHC